MEVLGRDTAVPGRWFDYDGNQNRQYRCHLCAFRGLLGDARIAEEVVQHLTGLVGANVQITIEIHADLPEGAGDKLVRDVTENSRTLIFTDYGFEED